MARFSQRFWLRLNTLDARVVESQRACRAASTRLLVGRRLVVGTSLVEYWGELQAFTSAAREATADLNSFCCARGMLAELPENAHADQNADLAWREASLL